MHILVIIVVVIVVVITIVTIKYSHFIVQYKYCNSN